MEKKLAPLIMVGGTDGSGKGLVVDRLVELCKKEKVKLFDLREYEKENTIIKPNLTLTPSLPKFETIKHNELFVCCEPTKSEIGYATREAIKIPKHDTIAVGELFSSDRYNLDLKLTIPCRENNIPVIKERGVESSLIYQYEWAKFQKEELPLNKIIQFRGNYIAFKKYPPTYLIITHCPVDVSIKRLSERDKKDDAVYEKKEVFMQNVLDRYLSKEIKELFESVGTKVLYLNTDTGSLEKTINKIDNEIWSEIKQEILYSKK